MTSMATAVGKEVTLLSVHCVPGTRLEDSFRDCWSAGVQVACCEALLCPGQCPCPYPTVSGVCFPKWVHNVECWAFHAVGAWPSTSLASYNQFDWDTFKPSNQQSWGSWQKKKRSQIKKQQQQKRTHQIGKEQLRLNG